ncbi:PIN domain-containing protein [Bdellovibrionota bacterium FG-2]
MILVDTSVWVDLLGSAKRHSLAPERMLDLATCSPVIQEVLQGIKNEKAHQRIMDGLLALPRFEDPPTTELYLEASELYRSGRRRWLTIRSSTDCLIAAIALRHRLTVWHADRDFSSLAAFTDLRVTVGS